MVELVVIGLALIVIGVGLAWWASDSRAARRHQSSAPSAIQIELEAMQRAARIRDLTRVAEAHMDDFIAQREAERRHTEADVVNGEVVDVRDELQRPRWSR